VMAGKSNLIIQTSRSGSKSVPGKNLIQIDGLPLMFHNLRASAELNDIADIVVTTDIDDVFDYQDQYNYEVVWRPEVLRGDDASHYDTILHALCEMERKTGRSYDLIIVVLGNARCAFSSDIRCGIKILENDAYESVISVSKYNMFNPYRAFCINDKNMLVNTTPSLDVSTVTKSRNDKNAMGDIYFFNGGFWIIRKSVFLNNNGLQPFPWLGKRIFGYVQDPRCMEIDDEWQVDIVKNYTPRMP
jgi:CMP-N-acetylneuraminic acid synthetase